MLLHRFKRGLLALTAACLLFSAAARAETEKDSPGLSASSVTLENAVIGYNGLLTYTKPMPLTVTLYNAGPDVSGVLAVNLQVSQREYDRYELPLTLAGGTRRQVTLPLQITYRQARFAVSFVSQERTLCAKELTPLKTLAPETLLVGVLSQDAAALSYMNITTESDDLRRGESWQTLPLTLETFPETEALLRSFGLLLVDNFDATQLNEKQKTALDQWLRGGGVLVLGGGAQASAVYPAFSAYTGITPGQPTQAPDITPALSEFLGVTQDALGRDALVNEARGGQALIQSGETPLVYRTDVGAGVIYTAAFEWGAKPLSSWGLIHSFLQRLLLKDCPDAYQSLMNLGRYAVQSNDWDMNAAVRSVPVQNAATAAPMLALVIAYLLLGGVGGYLILKKLDKREWLWGLFPALTALCIAGIALLGRGGGFSQPMAVAFTHYNLDQSTVLTTYAALSVSDGAEHKISSPDGDVTLLNEDSGYYDYYNDTDAEAPRRLPTVLRYRYYQGAHQAVGVSFGAPWTVKSVAVQSDPQTPLQVSAALWPEADGLHGRIENLTDYPLREGIVFTAMGFCSIPDLMPGKSASFALLETPNISEESFMNGVLSPELQENGYYSLIWSYLYPESAAGLPRTLSAQEETARSAKQSMLNSAFNAVPSIYESNSSFFRYIAFNDSLRPVTLLLDDQEVTRSAQKSMLSVSLDYRPVGPNGDVFYATGLLQATVAEGGDAPRDTGESARQKSYRLMERPAFCFTVPQADQLSISSLTLSSYLYGAIAETSLYNQDTAAWDVWRDMSGLSGGEAAPYLRNGRLYIRYQLPLGSTDTYSEVQAPSLTIRGKVK